MSVCSGHGALSNNSKLHIIQNLSTGNYDLHAFGEEYPIHSLEVGSTEAITMPCYFAEDDHVVVLAGDDGRVRICEVGTGRQQQVLVHGDGVLSSVGHSGADSQ